MICDKDCDQFDVVVVVVVFVDDECGQNRAIILIEISCMVVQDQCLWKGVPVKKVKTECFVVL